MFVIAGLGNPGEEYKDTRHNVGRIVADAFIKKHDFDELFLNKKISALASEGKLKKEKVVVIEPETFMNKSGLSLKSVVKSAKAAENLIVIRDDLDLPLGSFKISFNRGSGGHKGVESIQKQLKTEAFVQLKMGISPHTASGKIKKPQGDVVLDFIIGKFKKPELEEIKKLSKKAVEALEMIILDGREAAMGEFNQK